MAYAFNDDKSRFDLDLYGGQLDTRVEIPNTSTSSSNLVYGIDYTFGADGYLEISVSQDLSSATISNLEALWLYGTDGTSATGKRIHVPFPKSGGYVTIPVKKGMIFYGGLIFPAQSYKDSMTLTFIPLVAL